MHEDGLEPPRRDASKGSFGVGAPKVRGGAPLNYALRDPRRGTLQRGGADALRDPRRGKAPTTVHEEGLEPPRLAAPEPKSGASANSATRARSLPGLGERRDSAGGAVRPPKELQGWQVFAAVSQPFSGSLSESQWPGWQEMMRQVPPRQAASAWATLHWTPQTPQFWASSASTASQALAGLRSQSAVPGAQFWRRSGALGSSGTASRHDSSLGLSAEFVTGTRAAQLPKPNEKISACSAAHEATRSFTPR